MTTIFDKPTKDELITRINTLNENSIAQWGKMNVHQMMKHCIMVEEMYLDRRAYDRAFIGRIFGKVALKSLTKDEQPMRKNSPTGDDFKINDTAGDVAAEKAKWASLVEQYAQFSHNDLKHWFFGKMTREQVGILAYKHIDHHLRQFNS